MSSPFQISYYSALPTAQICSIPHSKSLFFFSFFFFFFFSLLPIAHIFSLSHSKFQIFSTTNRHTKFKHQTLSQPKSQTTTNIQMYRKPKTKPKPTNIANPTQIRAFTSGIQIRSRRSSLGASWHDMTRQICGSHKLNEITILP